MSDPSRIVVTGIGPVTPIGTEPLPFWSGLKEGRSGIRPLTAFKPGSQATRLAAEVIDFDAKKYIKQRKSIKVMARDIQLAVGAAQIALDDSRLPVESLDRLRFGVNCGAGLIATELEELGPPVLASRDERGEFQLKRWGVEGLKELFPLWMLKYLPNMPACHISIIYDAQGPNNSITAGEASAVLAMGEAYRVMARGLADVMIAGGADSKINPLSMVRLELLGRLSQRFAEQPEKASRPFDKDRDGLVAGEGAAMLVFEERGHAERRGARIYGEILGFGSSCSPRDHRRAGRTAFAKALQDAGLTSSELGHVISGAAGEIQGDRNEAEAIAQTLGEAAPEVPVIAYKSYFGHLAAASGAAELAASLLAAAHGELPAIRNLDHPDPALPKLRFQTSPAPFPYKPFALLSISRTGHAGVLIVKPGA